MASIESKVQNIILKYSNLKKSFYNVFDSGKFGKGDINEPPKIAIELVCFASKLCKVPDPWE